MVSPHSTPPPDPSASGPEEELRDLERRLRRGEELVRNARDAGEDRERIEYLETAWLKLLHYYEVRSDRYRRHAGPAPGPADASPGPAAS